MYLIDTNVFLEILLKREKSEKCKKFLEDNRGKLNITDFSLHSVGVILFRLGKEHIFSKLMMLFPGQIYFPFPVSFTMI